MCGVAGTSCNNPHSPLGLVGIYVVTQVLQQAEQLRQTGGAKSILSLIGNTPLVSFRKLTRDVAPVEVYAKAEWYNPGGSVKDRAALNMVLDGERSGLLTKDKVLVDANSGNTGIAYEMISAERV